MKDEYVGYVYIFTNPSFPLYVKIGYADNVEERLKQLNRSECTPFAFRCYATYQVNHRLTDMKIHNVIDKLNPTLRSIDNVNGKKRVREFYAISAEDAYSIFEAIAELNGNEDRLKKWELTEKEKTEEETSEEIEEEHNERLSPFAFSKCNIQIGEKVYSKEFPDIECEVYDDKHVLYEEKVYSLSTLARDLLHRKHRPAGPRHFTYKGKVLSDLRDEVEKLDE